MTSMQTIERRVLALESRLADVEVSYGQSIYQLRRDMIRSNVVGDKIAAKLGIPDTTEEEIDAIMDRQ